jgi:hypothetical protein
MLDRLRRWVDRRARQNATVIDAAKIFEQILAVAPEREGYKAITVIRDTGQEQELRKWFLETVVTIVSAEIPMLAMRRELMQNVRNNLRNRLLFSDELYPRREEIYRQQTNPDGSMAEWANDNFTKHSALWTEAESICLRHIQNANFEITGPDDWWTGYVQIVELWTLATYRCMLDRDDEVSRVLLTAANDTLRDYERRIEAGAPTGTVPPSEDV